MKKFLLIATLLVATYFTQAQKTDSAPEPNYIEVTGEADTLVVPDEIYIEIRLKERYDGRTKITLDSLEQQLKTILAELKIDLKNLSLSDANSEYVRVRWTKKDNLDSREYLLKAATAPEVSRIFDAVSDLKGAGLRIGRINHTQIEILKKDVRVKAIRDAKEKAGYLLAAAGSQLGPTIRIREGKESISLGDLPGVQSRARRFRAYYSVSDLDDKDNELDEEVAFRKMKIEYKVTARFEIR